MSECLQRSGFSPGYASLVLVSMTGTTGTVMEGFLNISRSLFARLTGTILLLYSEWDTESSQITGKHSGMEGNV